MAGSGTARSARVEEVVRWFGLDRGRGQVEDCVTVPEVEAGEIVYITGASGAGKSRLLGRMREESKRRTGEAVNGRGGEARGEAASKGRTGETANGGEAAMAGPLTGRFADRSVKWVDLDRIVLPRGKAVVECLAGGTLVEVLRMLSRVGLAEAWDWVRTPAELSEGQRFRLRMAMGLWRAGRANRSKPNSLTVLACDEFCAVLDRITARVVARTLRRTLDRIPGTAAVVVTSHEDLEEALRPDVVVRCDFGKMEVRSEP